eukprot:6661797-Karenia_brevis.AAC.1
MSRVKELETVLQQWEVQGQHPTTSVDGNLQITGQSPARQYPTVPCASEQGVPSAPGGGEIIHRSPDSMP